MTLLVTVFAAVICTVLWYQSASAREIRLGMLCCLYWGASLMWLVDAVYEYAELGAAYFTPAPADMLNDLFLGLSVIAFGQVLWLIVLLVKDPKGVVRETLLRRKD